MKASRYNHIVRINDGTVLAYNCLTGVLAEIKPADFERIKKLLDIPGAADDTGDVEFREDLIEGGYLIPDGTDEVADMERESWQRRQQQGILTLTVAPTLACNFACDYCFVDRADIRMSPATQAAFIRFVRDRLDDISRLRVSWFGGEPTLCFPIIEKIQQELNEMAARRGITMGPNSMVSNGYLLDAVKAGRLADLGVDQVQITLDGPEKVHDARRGLHNGRGTFKQILENLENITDILKVHVRINVDKRNLDSAIEVIKILNVRQILPKVTVGFAQVVSTTTACAGIMGRCFCEEEFSRCLIQLYQKLIEIGIYQIEYPRSFGGVLCGALTENCFAVSPTGLLFRCRDYLSPDPDQAIGDIFGSPRKERQKQNLERFRQWDPLQMSECRQCDVLPICMGGCPLMAKPENLGKKGTCSPWRYNLGEMLKLKYLCETQKQKSNQDESIPI